MGIRLCQGVWWLLLASHMPQALPCHSRVVGQPSVPGMSPGMTSFASTDATSNVCLIAELRGQKGHPEVGWSCVPLAKCLNSLNLQTPGSIGSFCPFQFFINLPQEKALHDIPPLGCFQTIWFSIQFLSSLVIPLGALTMLCSAGLP